jgi:hypothetical protein
MPKFIILANILIYAIACLSLAGWFATVLTNSYWVLQPAQRILLLIMLGVLPIGIFCCALGLLIRADWGLKVAVPCNIGLAMVFGLPSLLSIFILGFDATTAAINLNLLFSILIAVLLIGLTFGLRSTSVRNHHVSNSSAP